MAEGSKLYQSGQFAEAAKAFNTLLSFDPLQPPVLTNLGLAEYQAGHRGLGVGLWRKALVVDPTYVPARKALNFAEQAMQLGSGEETLWLESFRKDVLSHISLDQLLGLTLIMLLLGGWRILTFLGLRRVALRDELPMPPFSWVGAVFTVIFFAGLATTSLKAMELREPRATAVVRVSARTGPSENSSSIFELREGVDVILRQAKKGWTQIRHPGGMSGWVPNEALYQTSGMPLW